MRYHHLVLSSAYLFCPVVFLLDQSNCNVFFQKHAKRTKLYIHFYKISLGEYLVVSDLVLQEHVKCNPERTKWSTRRTCFLR